MDAQYLPGKDFWEEYRQTGTKQLLKNIKKVDQAVIWKLDRLGRSLRDLVDLVALFSEKEVNFISLHDHINTTTATGRFTFNIFASLPEFEREIIHERTKARLDAARARGKKGGRPKGLSPENLQLALTALNLHDRGKYAISEIANRLQMPIVTCYRYIKHVKEVNGKSCS